MASDKQDRRDLGPSGLGPGRSGCALLTDLFPEVAKIRTPARAAQRAKESTAGQRLGLVLGPQEGPANWPTLPGTAVTGATHSVLSTVLSTLLRHPYEGGAILTSPSQLRPLRPRDAESLPEATQP